MSTMPLRRSVWLGLAAAPVAWTVQGLAGWFLGAWICRGVPVATARVATVAIGIVALLVALFGVRSGLAGWREARAAASAPETTGEFLTFGAVFVSVSLAVGIAWATLNGLLLDGCGGMR